MDMIVEINEKINIAPEDIDTLLEVAFDGGINHWCDNVDVVGDYIGDCASEQISRGGQLKLHDKYEDVDCILTQSKLQKGLYDYLLHNFESAVILDNNKRKRLDIFEISTDDADWIIQMSLFGDVIYYG